MVHFVVSCQVVPPHILYRFEKGFKGDFERTLFGEPVSGVRPSVCLSSGVLLFHVSRWPFQVLSVLVGESSHSPEWVELRKGGDTVTSVSPAYLGVETVDRPLRRKILWVSSILSLSQTSVFPFLRGSARRLMPLFLCLGDSVSLRDPNPETFDDEQGLLWFRGLILCLSATKGCEKRCSEWEYLSWYSYFQKGNLKTSYISFGSHQPNDKDDKS